MLAALASLTGCPGVLQSTLARWRSRVVLLDVLRRLPGRVRGRAYSRDGAWDLSFGRVARAALAIVIDNVVRLLAPAVRDPEEVVWSWYRGDACTH